MGSAGVTVTSAPMRHVAELAKLRLESAGIAAWLADEGVVAVNPLLAGAVGWIKVQVDPADEERARAVLEEVASEEEIAEGACLSCRAPMRDDETKCSKCGWSYV